MDLWSYQQGFSYIVVVVFTYLVCVLIWHFATAAHTKDCAFLQGGLALKVEIWVSRLCIVGHVTHEPE